MAIFLTASALLCTVPSTLTRFPSVPVTSSLVFVGFTTKNEFASVSPLPFTRKIPSIVDEIEDTIKFLSLKNIPLSFL